MTLDLRAGLVAALDRLRTRLAVGEHGDPHVGFAVFVYPDAEPTIVALTERGAVDLRTLVSASDERAAKDDGKRWFTMPEFDEAADALADAGLGVRLAEISKDVPGERIAAEIRRRWETRRERPIVEALERAEADRLRPVVCEGCKRRFTERGLALHLARSSYCPAAKGANR